MLFKTILKVYNAEILNEEESFVLVQAHDKVVTTQQYLKKIEDIKNDESITIYKRNIQIKEVMDQLVELYKGVEF